MRKYGCILFDLYNTIIEGDVGHLEREQYRLDSIYTILEKSLYPVKFAHLQECYGSMTVHAHTLEGETGRSFPPFNQVDHLLKLLKIDDSVVFKKVYDVYVDAILQISPRAVRNADKALAHLKENGIRTGMVSNTGRTPGYILKMLLRSMNLFQYFDDMVFSDEAGVLKPNPVIFDLAVARLGAKKGDTVFIGDLKSVDYDGAMNAGLAAHLYRRDDDLYKLAVDFAGGFE